MGTNYYTACEDCGHPDLHIGKRIALPAYQMGFIWAIDPKEFFDLHNDIIIVSENFTVGFSKYEFLGQIIGPCSDHDFESIGEDFS